MSVVICSLGSAWNSSHDHVAASSTAPLIVNVQSSRSTVGVGPADSTGKSSVTYWPGGIRLGSTSRRRRPPNPREIKGLIRSDLPDDVRAVDGDAVAVWIAHHEGSMDAPAFDRREVETARFPCGMRGIDVLDHQVERRVGALSGRARHQHEVGATPKLEHRDVLVPLHLAHAEVPPIVG